MKAFALYFVFLSIPFVSCASNKPWRTDGSVYIDKTKIPLDLQNAYGGLENDNEIFIIGFKIDPTGKNHPTVVKVDKSSHKPEYWSFSSIIKQIFTYKKRVHILDMQGHVFEYSAHKWKIKPFKLTPKSIIVSANGDLLACYPSSPYESKYTTGACYQVNGDWKVNINWRDIEPQVCGKYLVAIDQQDNIKILKKYLSRNGKLIYHQKIDEIPMNLCSL